jgi:hypothetical protein
MLPPDGFPSLPDALHVAGFHVAGLRDSFDSYLIDLRLFVHEEISHMDDPMTYVAARDYLNAVEQARTLLG